MSCAPIAQPRAQVGNDGMDGTATQRMLQLLRQPLPPAAQAARGQPPPGTKPITSFFTRIHGGGGGGGGGGAPAAAGGAAKAGEGPKAGQRAAGHAPLVDLSNL